MKRRPSAARRKPLEKSHPARLIQKIPTVYLGPGALDVLNEGRGLLLGAQRPGWVDVLDYEPLFGMSWLGVARKRFEDPPEWDVVGVAISKKEFERSREKLVRELVPGDVLLALSDKDKPPQIFVHLGDRWTAARLEVSRGGPSTSARPGRL